MTRLPSETIDPLSAFLRERIPHPHRIPLVSTGIDVDIRHGVAAVSTTRIFRNVEEETIEATMTFPVPVHATLHALEARIGGRTLAAQASRSDAARETYEGALEEGRTAILHEEILKGLHMLSVGAVGPGEEAEVTLRWCSTLAIDGDRGSLRIPTTLGDVYGSPPVPDSDAPIHGGDALRANVRIRCTGGQAALDGHDLGEDGRADVMLDAPLDIRVAGLVLAPLEGRAADGRPVRLSLEPATQGNTALDLALLVDRSGSMAELADHGRDRTKHQQVLAGLQALGDGLAPGDDVELWQFDNHPEWIGRTTGAAPDEAFRNLVRELGDPRGGTEIGRAMTGVIGSGHRDLLVVTDGKSYTIDVHALAGRGVRITVLLIGEDSLDGSIAHLATLSGGEVFVAAGFDIERAMGAALASIRRAPPGRNPREDDGPHRLTRGGADLEIRWDTAVERADDSTFGRVIGALAASLVLPALDEEAAAALALSEGLVTHLTSLVLVDTEGQVHEGLSASRKIPLATPRTDPGLTILALEAITSDARPMMRFGIEFSLSPEERLESERRLEAHANRIRERPKFPHRRRKLRSFLDPVPRLGSPEATAADGSDPFSDDTLVSLARSIDWGLAPRRLIAGDLSRVAQATADRIQALASSPRIAAEAHRLSIDPIRLVIGLLARALAPTDRIAARVARTLLADQEVLGLQAPSGGSSQLSN